VTGDRIDRLARRRHTAQRSATTTDAEVVRVAGCCDLGKQQGIIAAEWNIPKSMKFPERFDPEQAR
jgi:hypothetical protein